MSEPTDPDTALRRIDAIRDAVGERFRDEIVSETFRVAEGIAAEVVHRSRRRVTWDEHIDRVLTHPIWGWPVMVIVLAAVLWITVVGANVPSALFAGILMDEGGAHGVLPFACRHAGAGADDQKPLRVVARGLRGDPRPDLA